MRISTVLCFVGFIAVLTGLAHAQVSTSGTVTGPKGATASRQTQRVPGSVNSTTTGPNGQMASRNVNRSAGSASATMTGPKGNTGTRNRTTTR